MIEVDLSADVLLRHRGALRAIGLISGRLGTEGWCVVGGMMVLIAARAVGHALPRAGATKDGDLLIDVCARPGFIGLVVRQLKTLGYELVDTPPDDRFARCTFTAGGGQIDVLCPDDAPSHELDSATGVRSIAIPGGRRALHYAQEVRIHYTEAAWDVDLRVPLLPGALVVKAAAMLDSRTEAQSRHAQDVAQLLSIVDDPVAAAGALTPDDLEVLVRCRGRLGDPGDNAWADMGATSVRQGQAALDLILS